MCLRLRNSGLRPSDSLAAAAHFISWNYVIALNVLLTLSTHLFYFTAALNIGRVRQHQIAFAI